MLVTEHENDEYFPEKRKKTGPWRTDKTIGEGKIGGTKSPDLPSIW